MIYQRVTRVSLESFRERSAGKKVVLLYPWTNYRNLFLGFFLSSAQNGLLYYRIPHAMTTLRDWLADMMKEFNQVVGGFGDRVKIGDPGATGKSLAAALGAYRSDRVILFIDELHLLVGAGRTDGSMDAANILKPALARGELHAIGATTLDEFRKYIEKDAALERRFQPVLVREPNEEDSISILPWGSDLNAIIIKSNIILKRIPIFLYKQELSCCNSICMLPNTIKYFRDIVHIS